MIADLFAKASVIREPVAFEPGYWAGAPGAFYDSKEDAWYLTYRIRRPRGVAPDRGGEARIARSIDLKQWEDVWSVTKDQFNSASIERCAIRKGADGRWRYFVSYVDPEDNRWCVSQISAKDIKGLDAEQAKPLFTARALGLEGIKDPWIYADGEKFCMLVSVALPTAQTNTRSHSTADIYNTGDCASATGLAVSGDLDHWDWQGIVFKPETPGWDSYCRRLSSAVRAGDKFLGFYDGSAGHHENYEEKCGIAVSNDWREWKSLSQDKPMFTSPHSSGSLRYVDAQTAGDEVRIFFEFARPDRSHDLRIAHASRSALRNLSGDDEG